VNYDFNDLGQLIGARGGSVGSSTNQVLTTLLDQDGNILNDTDKDGVQDKNEEWKYSTSSVLTTYSSTNIYVVIRGQAAVVQSVTESETGAGTATASRTTSTVEYTYNALGQLTEARGWTEGTTLSKVKTQRPVQENGKNKLQVVDLNDDDLIDTRDYAVLDTNGDRRVDEKDVTADVNEDGVIDGNDLYSYERVMGPLEEVEQTTAFRTKNVYAVVMGQALVLGSVTESETEIGTESPSRTVSTIKYTYNDLGQMTGAWGTTEGTTLSKVKTQRPVQENGKDKTAAVDVNGDGLIDTKDYAVSDTNGDRLVDEKDVVVDANGDGVLDGNDLYSYQVVLGTLEDVDQTTTFTTNSVYVVVNGQALVIRSVTESETGLGTATPSQTVSTVEYSYNALGQMVGARGWSEGTTFSIVKTQRPVQEYGKDKKAAVDVNGDGKIDVEDYVVADKDGDGVNLGDVEVDANLDGILDAADLFRYVDVLGALEDVEQKIVANTVNVYGIVLGQALVLTSETTTRTGVGTASVTQNISRMFYSYNTLGQLISVTGKTEGKTVTTVKTQHPVASEGNEPDNVQPIDSPADPVVSKIVYGELEEMEQLTTLVTVNSYAIILGQAKVLKSVTNTTSIANGGTSIGSSQTVTLYDFSEDGQLVGARGFTSGKTANQVWKGDTNGNGSADENEWVWQESLSKGRNTYVLIDGQAMVIENETVSESLVGGGTTLQKTTSNVKYSYNRAGQLIGASGGSRSESKVLTLTDTDGDGVVEGPRTWAEIDSRPEAIAALTAAWEGVEDQLTELLRLHRAGLLSEKTWTEFLFSRAKENSTEEEGGEDLNLLRGEFGLVENDLVSVIGRHRLDAWWGGVIGGLRKDWGISTLRLDSNTPPLEGLVLTDQEVQKGQMLETLAQHAVANHNQAEYFRVPFRDEDFENYFSVISRGVSEAELRGNNGDKERFQLFEESGPEMARYVVRNFIENVVSWGPNSPEAAVDEVQRKIGPLLAYLGGADGFMMVLRDLMAPVSAPKGREGRDFVSVDDVNTFFQIVLDKPNGITSPDSNSLTPWADKLTQFQREEAEVKQRLTDWANSKTSDGFHIKTEGEMFSKPTRQFQTNSDGAITGTYGWGGMRTNKNEGVIGIPTNKFQMNSDGVITGTYGGTSNPYWKGGNSEVPLTHRETTEGQAENRSIPKAVSLQSTPEFSNVSVADVLWFWSLAEGRGGAPFAENSVENLDKIDETIQNIGNRIDSLRTGGGMGETVVVNTVGTTINHYAIVLGNALVVEAKTHSETYPGDDPAASASVTVTDSWTNNKFNSLGQLVSATGGGIGNTTQRHRNFDFQRHPKADSPPSSDFSPKPQQDPDAHPDNTLPLTLVEVAGSTTRRDFSYTNTYVIVGGQALVTRSDSHSFSNSDGMTVVGVSPKWYSYNENGQLIGAGGLDKITVFSSVWTDPASPTENKQVSSNNERRKSVGTNNDAEPIGNAWNTKDGFYSKTTSITETRSNYKIIHGQAVVSSQVTDSKEGVPGEDGSSHTHSEITYKLNVFGQVIGATGTGWSKSWENVFTDPEGDGTGTYAIEETEQPIEQTFIVILGQAQVKTQTTVVDRTNPDGTVEYQKTVTTNDYDEQGRLIRVVGEGTFRTHEPPPVDGYEDNEASRNRVKNPGQKGTDTTGTITQVFRIINGRALLATSNTRSTSVSREGTSQSDLSISYQYDSLNRLVGAQGLGTSESDETIGTLSQTYKVFEGRTLLVTSVSVSTKKSDGTGISWLIKPGWSINRLGEKVFRQGVVSNPSPEADSKPTTSTTHYTYDSRGHLVRVHGLDSTSRSDSGGDNHSSKETVEIPLTTDRSRDNLDNNGDGVVDDPGERTTLAEKDGMDNNQDGLVDDPAEAALTTSAEVSSTSNSSWVTWTTTKTERWFALFGGKAKSLRSESSSTSNTSFSSTFNTTTVKEDGTTMFSQGGGSSSSTDRVASSEENTFDAVGRLMKTKYLDDTRSSISGPSSSWSHVWSADKDSQGSLTDYWIRDGMLDEGARVDGESLDSLSVRQINGLAARMNGGVTSLEIKNDGLLLVSYQFGLTPTNKTGGAMTVGFQLHDSSLMANGVSVQVSEQLKEEILSLVDAAKTTPDFFRSRASQYTRTWLQTASIDLRGDGAIHLTVRENGSGGATTVLSYKENTKEKGNARSLSLTLAEKTTVQDGQALLSKASATSPDEFGLWAAANMESGALESVSLHLPGYDIEKNSGLILSGSISNNGPATFQIARMQAGLSLFSLHLSEGQSSKSKGISDAVRFVEGLKMDNAALFAEALADGIEKGVLISVSLGMVTGFSVGITNYLLSADGRGVLGRILGTTDLAFLDGVGNVSALARTAKDQTVGQASLTIDADGNGQIGAAEIKTLGEFDSRVGGLLAGGYVDRRTGSLSIGRATAGGGFFNASFDLRDGHSRTFAKVGVQRNFLSRSWEGSLTLVLTNARALPAFLPLLSFMSGVQGLGSLNDLPGKIAKDSPWKAKLQSIQSNDGVSLFQTLGGDQFFSMLASGHVNLKASSVVFTTKGNQYSSRAVIGFMDKNNNSLASVTAVNDGLTFDRYLSPDLSNGAVREMLIKGSLSELYGIPGVKTTAEFEQALQNPEFVTFLLGDGVMKDMLDQRFVDGIRTLGAIDWSGSFLMVGYGARDNAIATAAIQVRGDDGKVWGKFTSALNKSTNLFDRAVLANLGNPEVRALFISTLVELFVAQTPGIPVLGSLLDAIGWGGITTVEQLESALISRFINHLNEDVKAEGVAEINEALGQLVEQGHIDWNASSLSVGRAGGSLKETLSVNLPVIGPEGSVLGAYQAGLDVNGYVMPNVSINLASEVAQDLLANGIGKALELGEGLTWAKLEAKVQNGGLNQILAGMTMAVSGGDGTVRQIEVLQVFSEMFSLMQAGRLDGNESTVSMGKDGKGNVTLAVRLGVQSAEGNLLGHVTGVLGSDGKMALGIDPNLGNDSVVRAMVPGIGTLISFEGVKTVAELEAKLTGAEGKGILETTRITVNGVEKTFSEVFGSFVPEALSGTRIDWSESRLSFGRNGEGKGTMDVSLAVRSSLGVLGSWTAHWEGGKAVSQAFSPNLGNKVVLDAVVAGIGTLMGFEGVKTVEDLEAKLKGAEGKGILETTRITVNGVEKTFSEVFGSFVPEALSGTRIDWSESRLSFGRNGEGKGTMDVSLAARSSLGVLGTWTAHWEEGNLKSQSFSPNLGNKVVLDAVVAGIGTLMGFEDVKTVGELEAKLKGAEGKSILETTRITVNGVEKTFSEVFGSFVFEALSGTRIDWSESRLSFGRNGEGKGTMDVSLAVRSSLGVLGGWTAHWEGGKAVSQLFSPNLGNKVVLDAMVAGIGTVMGFEGVKTVAELEAKLKGAEGKAILETTRITVNGVEKTFSEVFGSFVPEALSGTRIDWSESRLSFGRNGEGKGTMDVTLAARSSLGVVGSWTAHWEGGNLKSQLFSPNLGNKVVLDAMVAGIGTVMGFEGVKTVAELEAKLKGAEGKAILETTRITVNGVEKTFSEVFGSFVPEALSGTWIDWSESRLSFGRNGEGKGTMDVSLAARASLGGLGTWTAHWEGGKAVSQAFSPNLANKVVLDAMVAGIGTVMGFEGVKTVGELEAKLTGAEGKAILETTRLTVNGVEKTLNEVFGFSVHAALGGTRIDWSESRLSFGRNGEGKGTMDVSLAARSSLGVLGSWTAHWEGGKAVSQAFSPNLANKVVLDAMVAGIGTVMGFEGVKTVGELEAKLTGAEGKAILETTRLTVNGVEKTLNEVFGFSVHAALGGTRIDWSESRLSFGRNGEGKGTMDVSLAARSSLGVLGSWTAHWEGGKAVSQAFSPNLANKVVLDAMVAGIGTVMGFEGVKTVGELEAKLTGAEGKAILETTRITVNGVEKTFSEVFGSFVPEALSGTRIDWSESRLSFGRNGEGKGTMDVSLAARSSLGVLGSWTAHWEGGNLKSQLFSPNLGNKVVLDAVVPGIGTLMGFVGVKTVAELEAKLTGAEGKAILETTRLPVDGVEKTLNELFGFSVHAALGGTRIDWSESRLSFGRNGEGTGTMDVSLAARSSLGVLGSWTAHWEGGKAVSQAFSPNLANKVVLDAMVAGIGTVMGFEGVKTVGELEAKLTGAEGKAILETTRLTVNGVEKTLNEVFGFSVHAALGGTRIDWSESRLSFGRNGEGKGTMDVSLAARSSLGVLGSWTAHWEGGKAVSQAFSPNLANKVVLDAMVAGIGTVMGFEGVKTVEELEAKLKGAEGKAILEATKNKLEGGDNKTVGEMFLSAVQGMLSGTRIDWSESRLSFGRTGEGTGTVDVSLAARSESGILGRWMANAEKDGRMSVGLGLDLSNRELLSAVAGVIGLLIRRPDIETVDELKSMEMGRLFDQVAEKLTAQITNDDTRAMVANVIDTVFAGSAIDWDVSRLVVGRLGSGEGRCDLSLAIMGPDGRGRGTVDVRRDSEFGGMSNPTLSIDIAQYPSWFQGEYGAMGMVERALSPFTGEGGIGHSGGFLKKGSLDLKDGSFILGTAGDGKPIIQLNVALKDSTGKSLGRVGVVWDTPTAGLQTTWTGDLSDQRVKGLLQSLPGAGSFSTVNGFLGEMRLEGESLGQMQAVFSGMDMVNGSIVLGQDGQGEKVIQVSQDLMRENVKTGSATLIWDSSAKGFVRTINFEGPLFKNLLAASPIMKSDIGLALKQINLEENVLNDANAKGSFSVDAEGVRTVRGTVDVSGSDGKKTGVLNVSWQLDQRYAKNVKRDTRVEYESWGDSGPVSKRSYSSSLGGDGSWGSEWMTVTYTRNGVGELIGASGKGTMASSDGEGHLTSGTVEQKYTILQGRALLIETKTTATTTGRGMNVVSTDILTFGYDERGTLIRQHGRGISVTKNLDGTTTESVTEKIFKKGPSGNMMLMSVDTVATSQTVEEGISRNTVTTTHMAYEYDRKGKLVGASLTGTVVVSSADTLQGVERKTTTGHFEDWGGKTGTLRWEGVKEDGSWILSETPPPAESTKTETVVGSKVVGTGTIHQTFVIVDGEAKMVENRSSSETTTYVSLQTTESATTYKNETVMVKQKVWDPETGMEVEKETPVTVQTRDVSSSVTVETKALVSTSNSLETMGFDAKGIWGTLTIHQDGFKTGSGHYTMDRTITGHDGYGRATDYSEHSWNEGNGYSDRVRSNITYNENDQAQTYNDVFSKNGGDPVVVQVHDIQYDGLGREVLKNQTVTWSNSHYGMVPGLSDGLNGWQNGTATVTTATVYDDQGRVISTNSSGFVSPGATNADLAKSKYYGVIVASGFAFRSHSFSMVYDYMGRLVSSSYDNVSPGARSRSSSKKTVAVYEQRNFGTTTYSDFDPFGRAGTISSTSNTRWAGSKNKSSGTSLVTNIVYNSLGNVISQNEKYTSVSKVGKIKSTTRGEKNVTFTYNSKNELTARNETKVWEKTKTSSSGSKLGGLMKIFSIVLTVIALVLMQPYIVNAVYAVEGATVGLASSFAAGGSSFAAVVAGGSFTQALVAGAMMAAATFVVNFTVTLVFTGDFKAALRAGVMAGIGGFLSVMTVWVGGQFTGVMETLKSINGTLVNNLTDGVGKVFDGVISDVSKLLDGMKVFGTKIGTELASMMAKDMVTTLVKDVVTSLVSDTMTEKSPNLGFLSGLVSTVAIGLLGFGPSNFLSSFRPIMASMANAALGWILQKVLPSKMSWLSSMIMSFLSLKRGTRATSMSMRWREESKIE
jgi:hypothetical protein